jgi:putative ABC transport system permease protein
MIKNYFKIAFRNIIRHSAHSFLNISGMAIGMACAILILLWVHDEWSYDRHFEHADDLYRVIEKQKSPNGEVSLYAPTLSAVAPALKNEYPEIIRSSRIMHTPLTLKKKDEFIEETVVAVDKDFFKMFNIRFVRGDMNTAFNDPHSIVITEETAHKYFGNDDALGKTLPSRGFLVTVTGVVMPLPQNSHIRFDFLISTDYFVESGAAINTWEDRGRSYSYIELKKWTDSKQVATKIQDFIKKHKKGSDAEILLQNIKRIHLYSSRKYNYDISGNSDITYVMIMGLIAIFILLIACINFVNLSTAQSVRRAREISVRKVAGANKRKIAIQFLGESLLIIFMAHIIAMILVELLLPGYNNLTGKQLSINYQNVGLYIGLITIVLFCGLLAGGYPAFYLSSLKPLDIMKGFINKNPGNAKFRRVLVIFQFSLSILLIVCTLIIGKQLNYMQNKKLGFDKANIGYFMFPTRPGDPKLDALKKELRNNPDIVSVTKGYSPINLEFTSGGFNWTGKKTGDDVLFHHLNTDEDYAKTFQLELKDGRFFSSEFSTDNTAIVINEKAAEIMDLKNPVGEMLTAPWGAKLTIIGVLKDFHFQSLHYKIEPLMMQKGESNNLYVKMKSDHLPATVEFINKTFKSFDPGLPIDFHFLDDDFDKLYQAEQRMSKIFGYFSLLAIIISCLGLIGLSSFMTERRTKEIGIRKANGAKSNEIFALLSKEYIVLVLISVVVAVPIAWYVMYKWLQNFAYRTGMNWWIFAFAGFVAVVIAMLAIGIQSYKAARKRPVDALRYE